MTIEQQQIQLRRQLELAGIHGRRVLNAMQHCRRDLFVPEEIRHIAYNDTALPIGAGQTISQPYMVALMTEQLRLTGDETVLEIGTGSGYQCLILSELCAHVVTVERNEELSLRAREVLAQLGIANVEFHVRDGTLGVPERAPFDGIIVTAGVPEVPAPLYNQLKQGGRLVIPVGDESMQSLQIIEKTATGPAVTNSCGCRFVKLIGDAGWESE